MPEKKEQLKQLIHDMADTYQIIIDNPTDKEK